MPGIRFRGCRVVVRSRQLRRGTYGDPAAIIATVVTVDDVRRVALSLPRTSEHLIHDHVKFRVGRIVYLAFSRDETSMGFAFPKEERAALVAAEPAKFSLPAAGDMRYHWVRVWLAALDGPEMRELVVDAWRMVVPKGVAAAYAEGRPPPEPRRRR